MKLPALLKKVHENTLVWSSRWFGPFAALLSFAVQYPSVCCGAICVSRMHCRASCGKVYGANLRVGLEWQTLMDAWCPRRVSWPHGGGKMEQFEHADADSAPGESETSAFHCKFIFSSPSM